MNQSVKAPIPSTLALLPAAIAASLLAPSAMAQQPMLEVVTVVGEKTERSIKDTTSSVSVIGEDELNSMKHVSISSAVAEIPNVVVASGSKPNIRGVSGNGSATGFNSFTGGAKARVSRLVDGVAVPFVADLTGDTGLWDIEQIEVFRGPQSTNNGRSSIGGSIYIKTNDPSFDWQAKARLGARNQDQLIDTSVMASGPLLDDTLAFRLTAQRLDGDTYNQGTKYPTHQADFDLNELKTQKLRGKLLWKPAADDAVSVLLSHSSAQEQGDTGREFFSGDDPWDYISLTQRYMDTQADTTSVKVDYQFSSALSFELLAAVTDFQWGFDTYDVNPDDQAEVRLDEDDSSVDAKVRFDLPDSRIKGFVGLAYSDREQTFDSHGGLLEYAGDDQSSSSAFYSEVETGLSDNVSVLLGLRGAKEEQQREFRAMQQSAELDRDKTIYLPKLVLKYQLDESTTLAASSRKGYNQGGGALDYRTYEYYYFDEESVYSHELSARSSLLDNTLNINANLFYNRYSGYQASNSQRRIINVDSAHTYGLEMEVNALLGSDLELRSGLGLLETKILDGGSDYNEADDNRLDSAPGFTANIGSRYWFTHAISVDVSARYVSEYFGDIQNTKARQAGDYVIANLQMSYEQGDWLLHAFVNNLADEQARTVNDPGSPERGTEPYASIVDPRTIGASVTYTF
ncbi:TonB-dependent receptor [Bacterioplanes sanyensis]|uniref:TonB-dependent receptor n=1 Tax=Bacterioplanes sanyensis TaxID=1249553 RepID=A0A222FGS7_9GAMM|nr:TonB-dependent receptor plug domain-containing protein [Bacterioplanes sanyensis]ASP37950.1 TonB-dependent receptor [Bacterioplanes sanyensis]